ncbi:hypothetical protein GMLC_31030 [Geomonas limicola]|uniref:Uncharacterized protein n=1 Tax=Geomonas limicola TaxID=2740186 RepID=A0A6V8NCB8_9BACT|nr:hypothetical protein [Geomonas limicola]GFO69524.1 hypothetical protein GMLC_31030 [Geomonas limicola]
MRAFTVCLVFVVLLIAVPVVAVMDGDIFYSKFRSAVLQSQIKTVVAVARFPFEVRGTDDNVRHYDESGFRKIFGELLAQKELVLTKGQVVELTMYEVLKEKENLAAHDYLNKDFIRVGDFEFQLLDGKWRFTGAYLN